MGSRGPTPALALLERLGVEHRVHPYHLEGMPPDYASAVAAALRVSPDRLYKTLMAEADTDAVVAVLPASSQLSLKALAEAAGAKRARLMERADAERRTGFVAGGISPFGQKHPARTFVDASALTHDTVFVSAGRRGLQVEVSPTALVEVLGAEVADLRA